MTGLAPVPWSIDLDSLDSQWTDSISIKDAEGGHVVHLTRGYEGSPTTGEGCPSWTNARLIAAAPDLLEALKDLLNDCINFDGGKLTEIFQVRATAAIAKAEGRE